MLPIVIIAIFVLGAIASTPHAPVQQATTPTIGGIGHVSAPEPARDLRTVLRNASPYPVQVLEEACKAGQGTWSFESNRVACERLQTVSLDCQNEEVVKALSACKSNGATAYCDSYSLSCAFP